MQDKVRQDKAKNTRQDKPRKSYASKCKVSQFRAIKDKCKALQCVQFRQVQQLVQFWSQVLQGAGQRLLAYNSFSFIAPPEGQVLHS